MKGKFVKGEWDFLFLLGMFMFGASAGGVHVRRLWGVFAGSKAVHVKAREAARRARP